MLQFGKFEKLEISEIPKKFQIEKLSIWKNAKICDFKNSKKLQFRTIQIKKFETFSIWKDTKISNLEKSAFEKF